MTPEATHEITPPKDALERILTLASTKAAVPDAPRRAKQTVAERAVWKPQDAMQMHGTQRQTRVVAERVISPQAVFGAIGAAARAADVQRDALTRAGCHLLGDIARGRPDNASKAAPVFALRCINDLKNTRRMRAELRLLVRTGAHVIYRQIASGQAVTSDLNPRIVATIEGVMMAAVYDAARDVWWRLK